MATGTIILALASIAVAFVIYYLFPEATEEWFWRIARARRLVFGVFSILVAFVLLGSGSLLLMLTGGIILGLVALGAIFNGPFGGD